jgi:hypothetical protein
MAVATEALDVRIWCNYYGRACGIWWRCRVTLTMLHDTTTWRPTPPLLALG